MIRVGRSDWGRVLRTAGWLLVLCLLVPAGTCAQEWSAFREHDLTLRFRPPDSSLSRVLLADLVAGQAEIGRTLGGISGVAMTVFLAPSERAFGELTRGRIPHWGVGCAFPDARVIVLRKLPGQSDELLQVARHEISHVLLHQAVPGRVPVWFDEGVAMWVSHAWRLRQSADVFYAVLTDGLLPLPEIDRVLQFASPKAHLAYTQSLLGVTFLIHTGGTDAVARMVSDLAAGTPFDVALYRTTGLTPKAFEEQWRRYVLGRFSVTAVLISQHLC